MPAPIEIVRDGPVARVWLDRPARHNALSPELAAALTGAFRDLARAPAVRVVVLGGRGPSFCAGADIGALKAAAHATFEENLDEANRLGAMFAAVAELQHPVVARVQGMALGGGVGLACACDIIVASDDARFGLSEVRLGILPALISPYVIRRLGDARARELMLTGERIDAAAAARVGLANDVVPAGGLDAKVDERVAALLAGGPEAQARIKALLARWTGAAREDYRAALPRTLAETRSGAEAREGLAAFLEKRKPRWHPER